ncbi:MAG: hypothetical protein A2W99_04840 [Bacteroidetes bacterium GWF2_33_16]|nr:MAG: hypothetical protein A2X00_17360 [Bacteroidetes bacterium GWE2_32_14]OFY05996.1 MAG: hypothetical protein A2W99_04840 [Bacteroidetes bacterium GWF2_33_16]
MHKINSYLKICLLTIIFLLLYIKFTYIPYAIGLYFLISVLNFNYEKIKIEKYKEVWLILIFVLFNAFSLLYSENFKEGFSTIQTQLSLIIFPLLIIIDRNFFYNKRELIIKLFIIISLFSIFILCFQFFYSGQFIKILENKHNANLFDLIRNLKLSNGQHPSYISINYLFSVILVWYSLKKSENKILFLIKLLAISIILVFIFLLNSRAVLISILMVIIYYTLKYLVEHKTIYKIFTVIILIGCFFLMMNNTRFKYNLLSFKKANTIEQIDPRFSIWRDAFIVWKQKPIFGQGIGDSKDAIMQIHKKRNIEEAIKYKFNAHNQFLETSMQTGLVGLIILILVFSVPLYQSIKKKQELLFLFLMICIINFMFESMLQRIAGVVFFAFWYSFLWFVFYKEEMKVVDSK